MSEETRQESKLYVLTEDEIKSFVERVKAGDESLPDEGSKIKLSLIEHPGLENVNDVEVSACIAVPGDHRFLGMHFFEGRQDRIIFWFKKSQ